MRREAPSLSQRERARVREKTSIRPTSHRLGKGHPSMKFIPRPILSHASSLRHAVSSFFICFADFASM